MTTLQIRQSPQEKHGDYRYRHRISTKAAEANWGERLISGKFPHIEQIVAPEDLEKILEEFPLSLDIAYILLKNLKTKKGNYVLSENSQIKLEKIDLREIYIGQNFVQADKVMRLMNNPKETLLQEPKIIIGICHNGKQSIAFLLPIIIEEHITDNGQIIPILLDGTHRATTSLRLGIYESQVLTITDTNEPFPADPFPIADVRILKDKPVERKDRYRNFKGEDFYRDLLSLGISG